MLHHDTVVSEEDFLELPEALQRKVSVLSAGDATRGFTLIKTKVRA